MQYTHGVQNLIRFGHELLPVTGYIVDALRERDDPETGFHLLELPGLKRGDRIHIKSGAFAGRDGIFEARSGKNRVLVLLDILGQQAQTSMPLEVLAR